MSEAEMTAAGANPFSPRAALALVLFGAVVFVAMLWMIGAGLASGSANDGGNHAEGKGLNGFAAFSRFLESQGYSVSSARGEELLKQPGLLVLTPPHGTDPEEIDIIVSRRLYTGPTLLVLPKWHVMAVPAALQASRKQQGWVIIGGAAPPAWAKGLDSTGPLDARTDAGAARWTGFGLAGRLPEPKWVQSMSSGRIIPLVRDARGQVLAGYLDNGGDYPALAAAAGAGTTRIRGSGLHPVVIVAEPDLVDNYGFARVENAMLALALVKATTAGERMPVAFDLTLNGHGRSSNLLTLAFTPPFLAATLCLLLAALAVGWRAFLRFGPPARPGRAIAFGKKALVANAAGLIRRTRRLHLVSGPYGDSARDRIARALALPRNLDRQAADDAIDRALQSRAPGSTPFSALAAKLRAARSRNEVVNGARDLHALERTLTK